MCRNYLVIILLAFGIFAVSCSQQPQFSIKTLPSGRVVKVAGVMQISFSGGDQALMLKYYSDIDFSKRAELKAEVEDIWQEFQKDVDKAKLKSAIISANEMPHGIISGTKGFNFVYTKQAEGRWILNEK